MLSSRTDVYHYNNLRNSSCLPPPPHLNYMDTRRHAPTLSLRAFSYRSFSTGVGICILIRPLLCIPSQQYLGDHQWASDLLIIVGEPPSSHLTFLRRTDGVAPEVRRRADQLLLLQVRPNCATSWTRFPNKDPESYNQHATVSEQCIGR